MADAALEFHLPETILRVRVAEAVEGVEPRGRKHVGHGVAIADDVHGPRDAGHLHSSLELRQRAPEVGASRQERHGGEEQEDGEAPGQDVQHASHRSNDIR